MSNKDVEDHMRGNSGDMFAPGWGQVGYQQHLQRQERETQEQKRQQEHLNNLSSGSGGATSEGVKGKGL